jgi:hypothetical protein
MGICLPLILCGLLSSSSVLPAASLSLSFTLTGDYGSVVNLSQEGTLDWGHWGFYNEWTYNHKYGVPQQITYSFITITNYPDWPGPYIIPYVERGSGRAPFGWTDGMPTRVVETAWDGISIWGDRVYVGEDPGFRLQCPADTSLRTLRVYVGNSGGPATFTATLSGGLSRSDTSIRGVATGFFTVDFQADSPEPDQRLTVELTSTDAKNFTTLQAATLSGHNAPPTVAITAPSDRANFSSPGTFSVTATAADMDGTVTNLTLLSGTTPVATSASGALSVTLSNRPAGTYDLRAVAKDNGGLSITSFPVRVYVTTGGGTLTGSTNISPWYLDLTAEGKTDWAHWGLDSPASFNHKSGMARQIPDLVLLNASAVDLTNYNEGWWTKYSWSDGSPTAEVVDSGTGVFLPITNNPATGYQLVVPATTRPRCLKVYVGLLFAQGQFDARLSDFSATPYFDTSIFQSDDLCDGNYTITFASPNPGANLIVTWTPAVVYNPYYADLRWQAATLWEPASQPVLRVIYPPPASSRFAFAFYAQNGSNYTVQVLEALGSTNWQSLTNFTGTGADKLVTDHDLGPVRRFYRVLMQ